MEMGTGALKLITFVKDPDFSHKEACKPRVPPAPEAVKDTTLESETQKVTSEDDCPARIDKEFGTNCKLVPMTVKEKLPLDDPKIGTAPMTLAASKTLELTKDP